MKLSIIIFALFFALNSQAQTIHERLKAPLVGAHRGGNSIKGTNNTIEKFLNMIKAGGDIIETDIQPTKDGVLVIFHDATLDEDTDCEGKVSETTFEEIQKCTQKGGKKIDTFEDALIAIKGKAVLNAEFKGDLSVVVPAIKLVQKHNAYDWVYFQTKAERERYLLARKTDNRVALLYKAVNTTELDWILAQNDPYLVVIEMEKDMATPTNIKKVHRHNRLVSVNSWRYGTLEEYFSAACDKVFKLGIDIAIANNIQSCIGQKRHYKP